MVYGILATWAMYESIQQQPVPPAIVAQNSDL